MLASPQNSYYYNPVLKDYTNKLSIKNAKNISIRTNTDL
jgi:hypothetical protein